MKNSLQLWLRNTDGMTIDDLLEECKRELCRRNVDSKVERCVKSIVENNLLYCYNNF